MTQEEQLKQRFPVGSLWRTKKYPSGHSDSYTVKVREAYVDQCGMNAVCVAVVEGPGSGDNHTWDEHSGFFDMERIDCATAPAPFDPKKHDAGKPRLRLLPPPLLRGSPRQEIIAVLRAYQVSGAQSQAFRFALTSLIDELVRKGANALPALEFGRVKYKDTLEGSWRGVEDGVPRYLDALLRHAEDVERDGWESVSADTAAAGMPVRHVDHMLCNAGFVLELIECARTDKDGPMLWNEIGVPDETGTVTGP